MFYCIFVGGGWARTKRDLCHQWGLATGCNGMVLEQERDLCHQRGLATGCNGMVFGARTGLVPSTGAGSELQW